MQTNHIFILSKATVPNEKQSLETESWHHELLHNSIKCYSSQPIRVKLHLQAIECLCFCVFHFARGYRWPEWWWYQISHQVHAGQFIIQILPRAPAKNEQTASNANFNPAGQPFGGDACGWVTRDTGTSLPVFATKAVMQHCNYPTTAAM